MKTTIFLTILTALATGSSKALSFNTSTTADTLQDKTVSLGEVVVTGTRQQTDIRHLPMTVNVIGREALEEKERTSVLPTVAEQVPGMFVTSRGLSGYGLSGGGSGAISVRGLGSGEGRMMVLIDGHPQYSGIYNHAIADSYQTMMAERVEVLRGPASMIYGSNAMGGVINIVTHAAANSATQTDGSQWNASLGAGSYGTFQSSLSNRLRHKGFTSNVAAQYNRSDNHRPNMGFEQYGGHLNLAYDFNSHWHAFADADITHFNASNPGTMSSPLQEADQWITRGAVNAGVENRFGKTSGALTAYSNFGRHKINDGYGPAYNSNKPQTELFRSKDALSGLSLYQSVRLFEGNRLTAGIDYQHIYGHAYYTSRKTGEVVTSGKRGMQSGRKYMNEVAGYVNVHQDLLTWLTIDAGLRYNHHSVSGSECIPQGGLVVRPTSTSELKASVGKGFRNPTLKEMYMYGSANDALDPERTMNYELAWRRSVANGRVKYGVNVFYINGDNLIQTVSLKSGKQRNLNTGEIENWGAEAEMSWKINSHWLVSTNHSFLRMKHPVLAAPEYKGYLGARYTKGRWNGSLGLQQISGLFTEIGSTARKENATLLDASAKFRATKALQLWLRGENLLAQKYEINAGFPMPRATFMGGVNVSF